ncbi:hypothetical protein [Actinoallomurus bryophytorum]|uniref:hypothetical protein n=1 Tax=Actinoallomurus bryophytorum TaxID=1490222 RepID=UPI00114D97D6|nr:hypothetical protein [Actinoallomurus bryophytorum]
MGDYSINLPDDLLDLVKRWTAEGTMQFRWPTDDEGNYKHSGDRWGSGNVQSELEQLNPEREIKAVGQKNEGPAIDAFADFWRDVPARNIANLVESFKVMSVALLAMNAALIAYKNAAIRGLAELKKELDENQKWAWLPWSDDGEIHKRAQKLIGFFDETAQYDLEDFNATMANSTSVIQNEGKLYDDIAKRFTPDTEKTGKKLTS